MRINTASQKTKGRKRVKTLLVLHFELDQALPEDALALLYKMIDLTFCLNHKGGRERGKKRETIGHINLKIKCVVGFIKVINKICS